jgi:HUS1 checkpoint protein
MIYFSHTGICARHCIIMYVYIGETGSPGGVLTFYIPAILEPEEGA